MVDKETNLQEIINVWEEKLKEKGMQVNPNKSKVMHIHKDKKDPNPTSHNFTMNGQMLEIVDQYKYLGTIFTQNGKINQEVKHRISQSSKIYYQINKTVISKKEVDTKTKLQVYNSIYQPTLLYGAESWPITRKIESQIVATEMRYLRKITNKTRKDRERNTNIREQLNIKPITQIIENKQLKWYGHIKRMEKQRIPRKVKETRMEEKRRRGRPRVT